MALNQLRRVNWLWKHRHTHDGDTTQDQITVIQTTIQEIGEQAGGSSSGAYIHLVAASQTIATGGEKVAWASLDLVNGYFEFTLPDFPATTTTIPKLGYYNAHLKDFAWDTFTGGGTVQIVRTRDSVDTVVWEWVETDGQDGAGTAHAFHCEPGDTISVFVDHGDGSGQTLASAELHLYLVDREGVETGPWDLMFEVDNYGVTDINGKFWTTDDTADVANALFERDANGVAVNSYANFDTGLGDDICRSLAFDGTWLWGVGGKELVYKIDPADGTVDSTFSTGVSTPPGEVSTGIGYNGTNLFQVSESGGVVREFNTAGTLQATHNHPSGHTLRDVTWDGVNWWATTTTTEIVRMDSTFAVLGSVEGPTATNQGCHWRDGWLYVMTPSGLFRRAV